MKGLITPLIDRFLAAKRESACRSWHRLADARNNVSSVQTGQMIDLDNEQSIQAGIDAALEEIDMDTLFDPCTPNTGGMEVLATIKQDLSRELHSTMLAV